MSHYVEKLHRYFTKEANSSNYTKYYYSWMQ